MEKGVWLVLALFPYIFFFWLVVSLLTASHIVHPRIFVIPFSKLPRPHGGVSISSKLMRLAVHVVGGREEMDWRIWC